MSDIQELVEMTRTLGDPSNRYVIIGEGNTSYRVDDNVFWVKASGQMMHNIGEDGFVSMYIDKVLALFDDPPGDIDAMKTAAQAAKVDVKSEVRPSVEATFHAMLLAECNVKYIGHSHPQAVNSLMCSTRAEQFARHRLFPDEAVLCGPESVYVPYIDPGLPLAVGIRDGVRDYMDKNGEAPKVVLLANHGLIALGQTTQEVLNITAMCVKAAEIFIGACSVGGPVFMSEADINHIYKRPDEIYRRAKFVVKS